jgi:hypothetical protein
MLCRMLLLWAQAHVQQRARDAGGEALLVICYFRVLLCYVGCCFCGLKRMYSSVLEMLEVRHCL